MATKDTAALRKRAQIAKANRLMFLWIAGASVVVSASVVVVIMMVQKGLHNQRAISALNETVKTLENNNKNVEEIASQVRALGSDESLLKLRTNDADNALRVVLDALPAESNPSALGASLQRKLFGTGVTVETFQVSSGEVAMLEEEAEPLAADQPQSIDFQFTVIGTPTQLKALLDRIERSIRTIHLLDVKIETTSKGQELSAQGRAYYLPSKILELKNEEIKP